MAALLLMLVVASVPITDDEGFRDGVNLYEAFEFEKAAWLFLAAAQTESFSPRDRATAFAWLGLSYGMLGRLDDGDAAFKNAFYLDREVRLPPSAPPKVTKRFNAIRNGLPPPRAASKEGPTEAPPPVPPPAAKPPTQPPTLGETALVVSSSILVGVALGAAPAATAPLWAGIGTCAICLLALPMPAVGAAVGVGLAALFTNAKLDWVTLVITGGSTLVAAIVVGLVTSAVGLLFALPASVDPASAQFATLSWLSLGLGVALTVSAVVAGAVGGFAYVLVPPEREEAGSAGNERSAGKHRGHPRAAEQAAAAKTAMAF